MNTLNIKTLFPLYVAIFLLPFINMPPFVDDYNRFSSDVLALSNQGRLFTEYSYTLLQGLKLNFVPNIYYFSLCYILAISYFAYSFVIKRHNEGDHKLITLFFISIFSTPALIQNISFQVDSMGMFTAIYLSVIAGFYNDKSKAKNVLISTLALCIATVSYQISFNYYIVALAVSVFINSIHGQMRTLLGVFKYSMLKATPFIISVLFALYIKNEFITNSYLIEHSKFAPLSELAGGLLVKHLSVYVGVISHSFNFVQKICILLMALMYVGFSVALIVKLIREKKYHALVVYLLLPFVFLSMLVFPSSLLVSPVLEQRAITIYGTLFFIALSPVVIFAGESRKYLYAPYAVFLATIIMTVAAFTSAQKYTVERNVALMQRLYSEAPEELIDANGVLNVKVFSHDYPTYIGPSKHNIAYFPALNFLMRDYFRSDNMSFMFNKYFELGVRIRWVPEKCREGRLLKRSFGIKYYQCENGTYVSFR